MLEWVNKLDAGSRKEDTATANTEVRILAVFSLPKVGLTVHWKTSCLSQIS